MNFFRTLIVLSIGILFMTIGNVQAGHGGDVFHDLSEDDPYHSLIINLNSRGIVKGNEQGLLNGDAALNRAELVVIVIRASGIVPLSTDKNCFPDVKEEWFAGSVCAMVRLGWISGYPDGLFRPSREVTAGESAKISINALTTFQFNDLKEALSFLESRGMTMAQVSRDSAIIRKEAFARIYLLESKEIQQMDSEGNLFDPAKDTIMVVEEGGSVFYLDYNQTQYERHLGQDPIVLFFHAEWCPLCRASDKVISEHIEELEGGAVIFKVDFDTELELRKTYGVTVQDTFVVLNAQAEDLLHFNAVRNQDQIQSLIDKATGK